LTYKLSDHLSQAGVNTINRISLSSTGEIGDDPENKGTIVSCGTLRKISK
jgi:hypothetical protein